MGDQFGGSGQYCRCTFFGHATPDRAGARPYRVQCRVTRCDIRLPARSYLRMPGLVTPEQQFDVSACPTVSFAIGRGKSDG